MKRALTYIGAAIGAALLVLALAIVGLFGAAQTEAGKRWLAGEISRLASDPSTRITVSGIAGTVPFDLRVAEIEFADPDGAFAVVHDAALDIAPAGLLAGRVTIRRLSARSIEVSRQPKPQDGGGSSTGIDELLSPPLGIRLDRLEIGQLSLGAPILGVPSSFVIGGAGSLGHGHAALDLEIARQDAPGRLDLHLAYGGMPAVLRLSGTLREPGGEVLSSLFHHPDKLPLQVDIAGDGPLDDWHGHVAATAGPARIEASLGIAGADDRHLSLSGSADLLPLLPPELKPIIGGHATLDAKTILGATGDVTVERFELTTDAATITASGRYGARDDALAGTITLHADRLAPFSALARQPIDGAGSLVVHLGGTTAKPTGGAELTLTRPRFGDDALDKATLSLSLAPAGDPRDVRTPFTLSGDGTVDGVLIDGKKLPGGLGEAAHWHLAARFDRGTGRLDIDKLAVDDAGATLQVTGGGDLGDPAAASFAGEARLSVPDIAPFAPPMKRGALQLTAELKASADGRATAVLAGTLDRTDFGVPEVNGALGSRTIVRGTLDRAADGVITAKEVELIGDNAHLSADARRAVDGRISGDYRLDAPRLQAIEPDIAGQIQASGHLEGPPDRLSTTLSLDGAVRSGSHHVDRLAARLTVDDLAKPHGVLSADLQADGIAGTVSAEAQLTGDVLRIATASIRAAGARLDGTATIDLASTRIDGTVDARVPDLKPFSEAAGTALGGALRLQAKLTSAKGQAATATVTANGLDAGSVTIGRFHLQISLADLLGRPTGRTEMQIADLAAGAVKLTAARLSSVSTTPGRFAVTGDLAGTAGAPMALTLAATAGLDRGALDITLAKLTGKAAGTPVSLGSPLHIVWRGGDDVAFSGLSLALGDGRLTGNGALAAARPTAHLLAKALPVATIARFAGRSDVDGALGFEATLGGTRAQPAIHLVVDAEQLHFALASRPDLPALGVVASVDLQGGELRLKGRLAGPKNAAIGFAGSVPAAFSLAPVTARLPPDGALALHVEGEGDLGNLVDLPPLGEDRLSGRFAVDITVGGTVASPAASGKLTVDQAHYDSLATGTDLSGISFTVTGDRQRLTLGNFTASDGASGTVTVGGAVDLAASPGPALDLSAELKNFRALRRDDVTATVSGKIHVGGTATAPAATVDLTIDQADINIPDKLPSAVQPVQVTIIDSRTGQTLSKPPGAAAAGGGFAAKLDVAVKMPGRVFVRGRGLDSEWRGNITVKGSSAAPDITGSLDVVRGTFAFAGQTLTVTRGTITFPGGARIDPVLDVQASAQSTDIIAIIKVTGTAQAPKIALSSEPALPQDEILSRLLFGTGMSQITPAQGIEIAQAAASLAGGSDLSVLDKLRKGFGLDRLSLGSTQSSAGAPGLGVPAIGSQPGVAAPATGLGTTALAPGQMGGSTTGSGLGGTGVSAGKYVADGVYVGVTQGIGSGGSSVNVQVDVSRHVSVDTQAGTQAAGSGVGVDWTLDY